MTKLFFSLLENVNVEAINAPDIVCGRRWGGLSEMNEWNRTSSAVGLNDCLLPCDVCVCVRFFLASQLDKGKLWNEYNLDLNTFYQFYPFLMLISCLFLISLLSISDSDSICICIAKLIATCIQPMMMALYSQLDMPEIWGKIANCVCQSLHLCIQRPSIQQSNCIL